MTGVSYPAHVQAAAAAEGATGLAAMFQDSGGFSSAYYAGADGVVRSRLRSQGLAQSRRV
ncbi:CocE/NonD family hydrolase [Streptomyces sp. NPDC050211]|uniref:CocE/NonD family hydrolase n=1 Tax=Streptomyces sp. NPDC050211 TaxID=3154932 RepID=UPI00342D4F62